MYVVLNSHMYNRMVTALVLPPVDKHVLACKMVNSSATPAVTNMLYKIDSEYSNQKQFQLLILKNVADSHH